MIIDIKPGDTIRLKKQHPCGGKEWQVVRVGIKTELECLKCQHHVFFRQNILKRKVKTTIPQDNPPITKGGKNQQSH